MKFDLLQFAGFRFLKPSSALNRFNFKNPGYRYSYTIKIFNHIKNIFLKKKILFRY